MIYFQDSFSLGITLFIFHGYSRALTEFQWQGHQNSHERYSHDEEQDV